MALRKYLSLDKLTVYHSKLTEIFDDLRSLINGKANVSHTHAASDISSGTLSSDRLPVVPVNKGGTGSSTAAGALKNLGVNATVKELNYTSGVTSSIQTQLDNKAASNHTHTVDSAMSSTSTNPVQNKIVNSAINTALTNAKEYTDSEIASLINGAPTTLDTLDEIAAALEDNADIVDVLNDSIGTKANASDLNSHTGNKSNPHGVTIAQIGAASSTHTHNYAGSSSAGGSATSATKLTTNAGSATQPVYFSEGKPVATTYALNKTVPSDAKFTDTNTWRGIQNVLTSDSTTESLSAAQGKVLKGLVDGKADSGHTHSNYALSDHTHSDYAAKSHSHTGYASSSHTHTKSEITDFSHTHSEYAASNHSHAGYATSNHTHSNYAPLDSPALTGTPTAPTASKSDSSTQIATTAFVKDMGAGDCLYYNASGTTGTITLSDSIADYVYVGIKYTDNGTRMFYKEVPTYGNSLVTVIDRSVSSTAAMYISSTTLTFSGTSVTQSAVGMLSHHTGTQSEFTTTPVSGQQLKVVGIWGKVFDDGI